MKLSIFVPTTKPEYRKDPWRESFANFTELADEVVIVCGDKSDLKLDFPNREKIKLVYNKWRLNDYKMYGEQYDIGIKNTTGDWAIRCDPDYFFHEDDFGDIRDSLENSKEDVLFMPKKQFVLADRFKVKALMPIVFRGSLRGRIKFSGGGDLTWPVVDGQEVEDKDKCVFKKQFVIISDNVNEKQIKKRLPGKVEKDDQIFMMNKRIPVWNYDMCFKTKETIAREFLKQSKARFKTTGDGSWGLNEEDALNYFVNMQKGRLKQGAEKIEVDKHPYHIQEKVKNINKNQLGFNLFGGINEKL